MSKKNSDKTQIVEYRKSAQYMKIGLLLFLILLCVCVITRPAGLYVNSGISYYGNYIETMLPYSLVFLVNSLFLWKASLAIHDDFGFLRFFKFGLRFVAIMMLVILMTPDNIYPWLSLLHRIVSTIMFGGQFIMALAATIFVYRDRINLFLLCMATISGYAALVYLLQPDGYMIEAQIVFQVSIWSIYIRYLKRADEIVPSKLIFKTSR